MCYNIRDGRQSGEAFFRPSAARANLRRIGGESRDRGMLGKTPCIVRNGDLQYCLTWAGFRGRLMGLPSVAGGYKYLVEIGF